MQNKKKLVSPMKKTEEKTLNEMKFGNSLEKNSVEQKLKKIYKVEI